MKRTKRKKAPRLLLLTLALLLLLAACRTPAGESEPVSESAESEPVSESEPASAPESEPEAEPESEPATAKERMKKLVREEAGPLADELAAEKEADPVFGMDTSPDPEKVARLEEVKKRLAELREKRDEKGRYPEEDREEAEALELEEETLEISIPQKAYMHDAAVSNYAKYAYFWQVFYSLRGVEIPGGVKSPYLEGYEAGRKGYFVNYMEYMGNPGSNPISLLDLGPRGETQAIFSGELADHVKDEEDQGILILKVTEVFWGDLEAGDLVGFWYGLYDEEALPEAENFLFFVWFDGQDAEYDGKTIPVSMGFSYSVYEIRANGTLYAVSALRDASRLDGLTPEEGVKLVLRNYMKYYKALDSGKPLSAD